MQVALKGVLIEGAAQPGATPAELRGNVTQGVEPLELVAVQMLLHVEPESQLWWWGRAKGEKRRRDNRAKGEDKGGGKGWKAGGREKNGDEVKK